MRLNHNQLFTAVFFIQSKILIRCWRQYFREYQSMLVLYFNLDNVTAWQLTPQPDNALRLYHSCRGYDQFFASSCDIIFGTNFYSKENNDALRRLTAYNWILYNNQGGRLTGSVQIVSWTPINLLVAPSTSACRGCSHSWLSTNSDVKLQVNSL